MDDAACLHARVGRSLPMPWPRPAARLAALRPAAIGTRTRAPFRARARSLVARTSAAGLLLAALLLALWPHWIWMARRLADGSDEPWGIVALVTVLVLVVRDWRLQRVPSPAALVAAGLLALAAALARLWVPPLVAAAVAMTALAAWFAAARPDRSAAPLASLLLLALPLIATLQFYLGYPLRFATAHLAAPILQAAGFDVAASGAALEYRGSLVLVDPPCAGIGMLWVGAYAAALLSYLGNAATPRALANGLVAAACVFVANVARNAALFPAEARALDWPAWAHAAVGLAAFGLALVPIVLFVQRADVPVSERAPDRVRWFRRLVP